MNRAIGLQQFLTTLHHAVAAANPNAAVAGVAAKVFDAAATHGVVVVQDPTRVAVCDYLESAISATSKLQPSVAPLLAALSRINPTLTWSARPRNHDDERSFHASHANAVVFGPDGLERRDDFRIGISVLAPHTTYPDHQHPPEEIYLVLSPGQWRNREMQWWEPGVGGVVHNPPNIVHSMRSNGAPLLAVWVQWLD